jgi:hypothetical protein
MSISAAFRKFLSKAFLRPRSIEVENIWGFFRSIQVENIWGFSPNNW